MNGIVYTAGPAVQEHLPSGFLELKIGSTLRATDIGLFHSTFRLNTLPDSFRERRGEPEEF
jgi:hypothetical protein